MKCKICGITSFEDAMMAINAGADAIGFVFYDKSPRYITTKKAKKIILQLPPFVQKVALFVNEKASCIDSICQEVGATLAQLHFDASDELCIALKTPYLRVVRAKNANDIQKYKDEYRLVDVYCESYGGTGKRLNIEWFKNVDCSKIIIAGGLNDKNVSELKKYDFYGVDVSSGVEISYGIKDYTKVEAFIKNAK